MQVGAPPAVAGSRSSDADVGARGTVRRGQRLLSWFVLTMLVAALLPAVPSAAATQIGYRAQSFAGFGATTGGSPTGEKPESKLWNHDGSWWAAMVSPARNGAHTIHRLDGTTWVDTGVVIDTNPSTKEDVLSTGSTVYILSRRTSKLRRFTYASGSYRLDQGFPVTVPAPTGVEALTLARDSRGVLWITWKASQKVWVSYTSGDDRQWSAPLALPFAEAADVPADDISSVIAFQDGSGPAIGVMWSHQGRMRQFFAVHRDGQAADRWTLEVALQGANEADDHINLKTFGGQVFAVVKTSYASAGQPQIRLLVRSSSGSWDRHVVAAYPAQYRDVHTRPIAVLQIDEVNRQVYVFMTLGEGSDRRAIVYKRSNISQIAFPGEATVLIQGPNGEEISNATSMKDNATAQTGIVVLASDASHYWWNRIGGGSGPSNGAPVFDSVLGDRSDPVGAAVSVSATATDPDGDAVRYAASGLPPGVVMDASTGVMSGTLSAAGVYAVEVSASDGVATSVARFTWTVTSSSEPPVGDGYASVVLGDGPAAYWRLGERSGTSAADASGHGFGGVYSGGYALGAAGAVGDGDPAVVLDGLSGKVSSSYRGISGSGARTVESWIRTTSPGSDLDTIVEWGASKGTAGARWTFRLDGAGSKVVLRAEVQGGYAVGSTQVADGVWHHVALVLPAGATDVRQVRFYVDGVADPVASSAGQAVRTDATVGLAIGDSPSMAAAYGIHRYFDGVVDEVAVYPTALSATQLARHHDAAGGSGGGSGTPNGAPVFDAALGDRSDPVGAAVSVSATATDPDGDTVRYAASGLPPGVAIGASTGVMSGTLSTAGVFAVEVSASDGVATSVARFTWTVTSSAPPPPTSDGYASVVLGDGPSAYWRLGELTGTSAADRSGNGFAGTYSGGFSLGAGGAVGDGDAAVDLDGASGKVATSYRGVSGSGARTVEAWIRTTSRVSGMDTIVEWGASNGTAGARWTFRLHDTGSKGVLRTEVQGGYVLGSTQVDDGAWHHVAAVLPAGATDVSQVRLYVDGALDPLASSGAQAVRTDATVGLAIGDSPSMAAGYGIHRYFDGVVDEVAVYPTALSATQLARHHDAGRGAP